jgi:flagellar assembly factor FliW
MKISTYSLGEIEVAEEHVIHFEHGIPGFEQLKDYTIVRADEGSMFCYLQSVEDGDVAFIVTNPFVIYPQYEFDLAEGVLSDLKIRSEQDVQIWSIVTVKDTLEESTVNLMAPVIVNAEENLGKQVVLHDSVYRTKHPLFQQTPEASGTKG